MTPRQRHPFKDQPVKFKQIAVAAHPEYELPVVYALSEEGKVYWYSTAGWKEMDLFFSKEGVA